MRDIEADWMAAMRRGDFPAAWEISDQVLALRDPATRDDPALPYHQRWVWDGRPFAGRHVLVRCYHGLGDTLQFARALPVLRRHAASVTAEVPPELLDLLAAMPEAPRLLPFIPGRPAPPAECDLEIMELMHALRLQPGAVPPPYLHASPASLPRGAVGLCCQAGGWDPGRSVPPALLAAALAPAIAGRPVVLLQPAPANPFPGAVNPGGCPAEISATASLIAGLDLVITVDTMVAHLAGGLGRPVWLLLKHQADWRWTEGPTCPWYPAARLFRQAAPGDWTLPLSRIAAALRQAG